MIVDDRFLRIGVSNRSSRSMGLDTECNLAMEAGASDTGIREFIRQTRPRLFPSTSTAHPQRSPKPGRKRNA
ncbi:MAG: hypothetical protein P8Z31_11735 [Gammaproteobacteria bacterium]